MRHGINSVVDSLVRHLLMRWVPKWHEAFLDPATGLFYERLGRGFKPVLTGQRRLLTQCRQISVYSDAVTRSGMAYFRPDLSALFSNLIDRYRTPGTGGWVFALDDTGGVVDDKCDLYTLSFVIFAACHYGRATGDARAEGVARDTLRLIDAKFRLPGLPGLAEALDADLKPVAALRRQNPHMHLLEACLFAAATWREDSYLAMADEMVSLFYAYFFKPDQSMLCEFFTDELSPDPKQGRNVEPGHYFEWIWLLKKHAVLKGRPGLHDAACKILLDFAIAHGWDDHYGGIYDVLNPEGEVVSDKKRLWPFAEALKAAVLMLDDPAIDRDALKRRVTAMVDVFRKRYISERGFWTEWLQRDLTPATDYMPGTTPYHVYFGIMETLQALEERGGTKSIASGPVAALYSIRRGLSRIAARLRNVLRGAGRRIGLTSAR